MKYPLTPDEMQKTRTLVQKIVRDRRSNYRSRQRMPSRQSRGLPSKGAGL